jgi:hypothetical protein
MNLAALKPIGITLGVAATTGVAAGVLGTVAKDHTDGTAHTIAKGAVTAGAIGTYAALMLTPGLPSKPIASGVLAGAAIGLMVAMGRGNDAAAGAAAID